MSFEEVKCLGSPRTSQMPRSGSRQCRERALHLALDDRPQPVRQLVARARVQVDRVEHRAPDVVLHPGRRRRCRSAPAARRRSRTGGRAPARRASLAADPVHDLKLALVALHHVGDEVEEVVRLLVEAERVERPEHEGGVADPAVAIVPVAVAAGRLGQRGGGRGDHRARGRVGQALERQRAALEVGAPGVVREAAVLEPLLPVAARCAAATPRPPRSSAAADAPTTRAPRRRPRPRAASCGRAHAGPRSPAAGPSASAARGPSPRSARWPRGSPARCRTSRRRDRRSRRPARSRASSPPSPACTGSAAAARGRRRGRWASAGGSRERSSSWCQGPMLSASRTITQPLRVSQLVSSTIVPGM